MKKILLALLAGLALALGACSPGTSPVDEVNPPATPTPFVPQDSPADPPPDPLADAAEEIGESASYEACDSGDMAACDDLFLAAPYGSALESWADDCGPAGNPAGGWCDDERLDWATEADSSLSAADEFEVEMLVAFAFIDDATMDEACDWVDALGSDAYATEFANWYEPSMTTSVLPYNHAGASSAFDTWCSI